MKRGVHLGRGALLDNYGICVISDFSIYSFKKDLANHKAMFHVALGRLPTLEFNELQSE